MRVFYRDGLLKEDGGMMTLGRVIAAIPDPEDGKRIAACWNLLRATSLEKVLELAGPITRGHDDILTSGRAKLVDR